MLEITKIHFLDEQIRDAIKVEGWVYLLNIRTYKVLEDITIHPEMPREGALSAISDIDNFFTQLLGEEKPKFIPKGTLVVESANMYWLSTNIGDTSFKPDELLPYFTSNKLKCVSEQSFFETKDFVNLVQSQKHRLNEVLEEIELVAKEAEDIKKSLASLDKLKDDYYKSKINKED